MNIVTLKQICLAASVLWLSAGHCDPPVDADLRTDEPDAAVVSENEAERISKLDKCAQPDFYDDTVSDEVESGMFEYSCRTVRWFDGLFGSSEEFREEEIHGRLSAGTSWNEYEGWDPSLRLRLKTDLPNLSSRWNAFLGRVDEEDYIQDTETRQDSAFRRGIRDNEQPEWLFGLGYKGRRPGESGWDYSVGVRLRTPPQPYVKARYEHRWTFGRKQDLRFNQTFFWRDERGYGATTHLDSARELSNDNILRWELIGTLAEYTEGVDWWAAHTWYHRLGVERGLSLRSFARGRTDADVQLQEYGFELSYRRQLHREWLFLNAGPTLTWPRRRLHEERSASWGVAVLLEMDFGYYID